MLELKSILSKILRHFEISVPKDSPPMAVCGAVLAPSNGVHIYVQKR
jgi:cytochrome P450